MDENHASGAPDRPALLRRYMRALEGGDIDIATTIVQLAETDAALERILLAANDVFLEQLDHSAVEITQREDARPLRSVEAPSQGVSRTMSHPQPRTRRSPRWLGTVAAALLVAALLASFFALLSGRGPFGRPASDSTPEPTISSTTAPTSVSTTPTAHPTTPATTTIVVSTENGTVTAINENDGTTQWRLSGSPTDSLARNTDVVYVASHPNKGQQVDPGGITRLTAYNATTGAHLWQVSEPQLQGYTYMFIDGNVLVAASGYGDGSVYGLDTQTGKTLWTEPGIGGLTQRLITATEGVTYISSDSGFDAFNTNSGKHMWSYFDDTGPSLTLGNNGPSVVGGSGGLVYYYDVEQISGPAANQPAVIAFDAATGTVKTRLTAADIGNPYLVSPDGIAYTTKDNQLCAFKVIGAVRLWCAAASNTVSFAQGHILFLVSTPSALLYFNFGGEATNSSPIFVGALSTSSGKQLWYWQGSSSLFSRTNSWFVSQGNTAFLGTEHGVYAFRITDGQVLWHALPTASVSFIHAALAS